MEITFRTGDINYEKIIDTALPVLREKAKNSNNASLKAISGVLSLPGGLAKKAICALPNTLKEEIIISLINANSDKICAMMEDLLKQKGFDMTISDLTVKKSQETPTQE